MKSTTCLWTNRGAEEEGGELAHQLYSEQQAGKSECFQLVFTLPTGLTWLVPAKGMRKLLFSDFLAWVSSLKDLFAFQIWIHSHTQREIIRPLNCRRAQVELAGIWSGTANQPTTLTLCQGLPHRPSNLTLVSVCFSWLRGTPSFACTIKMWGRDSRASNFSVLVGDHAGDGNHTEGWLHSS